MSLTQPAVGTPPPHPVPGVPESPIPLPRAALGADTLKAIQFVPLERIHASPFNPRKDFDEAGIAELAESIRVQGLQQNLVVRPHPAKEGHFELMGGERRWRALKLLQADGAPCKVEAAADAESRARQLVENLQREDVPPMQEAQAFAELHDQDKARWSTANIAAACGKTQRFVQQRIALVRNLAPELKAKMEDGEINIEAARLLAATPQSLQKKVIEKTWALDRKSVDELRETIAEHAVPVAAAAFDATLYTGDYVEDGKRRFFGDVALFAKLQTEAARTRLAALKVDWPEAKMVKEGALDSWVWGDTGSSVKWNKNHKVSRKAAKTWTALVYLDTDHKIRLAEGVKPRPKPSYDHGGHRASSAPSFQETPERAANRKAFNKRLAEAAAKNPGVAARLVMLEIVRGTTELPTSPKILKEALPTMPAMGWHPSPENLAKAWVKIAALTDAQVLKALAVIGAELLDDDHSQMWESYEKECPAELLAIGTTLGVKPEEAKPPLAAIAADKAAKPKAPAAKKKAAVRKKHR